MSSMEGKPDCDFTVSRRFVVLGGRVALRATT
jgi:hypothetical protein